MTEARYVLTNFPFNTAKKLEKMAHEIPNKIPLRYRISLCVIRNTPMTTRMPNTISYQTIRLLKIKGSTKEAKKAPVENMAKVMETFDWFIASKKVIQCRAMMIPAKRNLIFVLKSISIFGFTILMYKNISAAAISILNQTKGIDPIEISSPKIAVNPAMKTKK